MTTTFDPQKHHRRSIRLTGYDYARAGAYFVTIVTRGRDYLFGEVVNDDIRLNRYGEVVQKWWGDIPTHFPGVETGAFVIMPNHVHGIIIITDDGRGAVPAPVAPERAPDDGHIPTAGRGDPARQRKPTLGQIVAYFKYKSTKEMNSLDTPGSITKFWQRNYYERIIRTDREMAAIWKYIENNPSTWADDNEHPGNTAGAGQ